MIVHLQQILIFVDQPNSGGQGQRKCGLCKQTGKLKFHPIYIFYKNVKIIFLLVVLYLNLKKKCLGHTRRNCPRNN